jgi:hypothetical protein
MKEKFLDVLLMPHANIELEWMCACARIECSRVIAGASSSCSEIGVCRSELRLKTYYWRCAYHARTHARTTLAHFLIFCVCFSSVALRFFRIIDSSDRFIDTVQFLSDIRAHENWTLSRLRLHPAQRRRSVAWPICLYKSHFISSRGFGQGPGGIHCREMQTRCYYTVTYLLTYFPPFTALHTWRLLFQLLDRSWSKAIPVTGRG